MRFGAGLRWVGAVAVILGLGGTALAQSGTLPNTAPQVGFERRVQLSPTDELTHGNFIVSRLEQISAVIRRQLDTARQARDVLKSLCLSDKLSQVDVAGRSAKDRQAALQAAVQRGDTELANHEFTIQSVLGQRGEQLAAEANQCIGEEVAFVGQTIVTTSVATNLPGTEEDNTELPPLFPPFFFTPPPLASPFR